MTVPVEMAEYDPTGSVEGGIGFQPMCATCFQLVVSGRMPL